MQRRLRLLVFRLARLEASRPEGCHTARWRCPTDRRGWLRPPDRRWSPSSPSRERALDLTDARQDAAHHEAVALRAAEAT
jgi:hypothetical protein